MDNIRSGVEAHSTTTAALNADIEALTAAKYSIEIASLKVAFGSVIDILGLVRVRVFFCPFLVRLLTMRPGRDGGRRYICRTGPASCQSVPRVEDGDRKERLGCVE